MLEGAALTLYRNLYGLRFFGQNPQAGVYVPQFGDLSTLVHDSVSGQLRLTEVDGTVMFFHDMAHASRPGGFLSMTEPGGNSLTVTQESGDRILEVERSTIVNGTTITDSFLYEYFPDGENQGRLISCTLRRRTGSDPWKNITRAVYSYYGSEDDFGSLGDLRTATRQVWQTAGSSSSSSSEDGAWSDVGTQYYRYYQDGDTHGSAHDLKFICKPEAFAKLSADTGDLR